MIRYNFNIGLTGIKKMPLKRFNNVLSKYVNIIFMVFGSIQ